LSLGVLREFLDVINAVDVWLLERGRTEEDGALN
jgi:hypothetical protein